MRINWLYLAMRSERDKEPVFICPADVATAKSAMVLSSVSPERWEMTAVYLARFAISIAASVSVTVPIWLSLINIELAMPFSMPSFKMAVLVTNKSSPTICTFLPSLSVSIFQPAQSSSAIPSSMEIMGYLSTHAAR